MTSDAARCWAGLFFAASLVASPVAANRIDAGANSCVGGGVTPGPGIIPADLPAFHVWTVGRDPAETQLVHVASDGAESPVATTLDGAALLLAAPLTVGEFYRVRLGPCPLRPEIGQPTFDYEAGEPLDHETALGISLSPLRARLRTDGSRAYSIDATLVADQRARAWLTLCTLEWSARSASPTPTRGHDVPGVDRAFAVACLGAASVNAITPGDVTVEVVAMCAHGGDMRAEASARVACDDAVVIPPPPTASPIDAGPEPAAMASSSCRAGRGGAPWMTLVALLALARREIAHRVDAARVARLTCRLRRPRRASRCRG